MLRIAQMITPVLHAKILSSALEPLQHGADDIVPMQSFVGVEDRREPRLDVHDAVVAHVLEHFVGDTLERLFGLHDAAGVRESFEIERQAAALRAAMKPVGQLAGIARGQLLVLLIAGELDDRLRTQTTVEVIV